MLDRKRSILIREMMSMIDEANSIQDKIDSAYSAAYQSLQKANITLGICSELAQTVPVENGVRISFSSVMGVEIPSVTCEQKDELRIPYGLTGSNSYLDAAYMNFLKVKELTIKLAEIENSVYKLAYAVKRTQKRVNALKNIVIPRFEKNIHSISGALEEKEREEFSRLKVIKNQNDR